MGSGVSLNNNIELIKEEYNKQLQKEINGNDCETLKEAKIEINKLRTLLHLIDSTDIDLLLSKKQIQQNEYIQQLYNLQQLQQQQQQEQQQNEEQNNSTIINDLKVKLQNRIPSLQEAFSKIDTTQSGYITKEEFIQVLILSIIHLILLDYSVVIVLLVLGNTT